MSSLPIPCIADDSLDIRIYGQGPPTQLPVCCSSVGYQPGRITFATLGNDHGNRAPGNAASRFDDLANGEPVSVAKIETPTRATRPQMLQGQKMRTAKIVYVDVVPDAGSIWGIIIVPINGDMRPTPGGDLQDQRD